jgi:predicted nucleic acid-binding protein
LTGYMPAKKRLKSNPKAAEAPVADYWHQQISLLGRDIVFVDTGAILEAHKPDDASYSKYFETTTDKFVTSPFVVAETVSRLIKSKPYEFNGPSGEQQSALALHFLRRWLLDHSVMILHIPRDVFEYASKTFEGKNHIGCDLNDIISFVIIEGLEQTRIASKDAHFRALGLTLYP